MRESRTSGSVGGPGDLVSTVELGTQAATPKGRLWKPFTYGDGTPVYPDMNIRLGLPQPVALTQAALLSWILPGHTVFMNEPVSFVFLRRR